jgi:5S rRNA maturation endonuclease (ribonuclease M5)
MAPCPAHQDRDPSLAIREEAGKVLLHCHAGCAQRDVIAALRARGLWDSEPPARTWAPNRKRLGPIVATYDYRDERGELLYQVVRFEPKTFRQRYPDGRGGWIWRKHPRQVLYHLPEVLESPIIFVVEGCRDVESLREHGFVATTNAGGANAPWLPEYTATLAGREVNIVPDNDGPGWERVKVIARALLGHAARIRVLDLPRETKDISDWFGAGHSECELIAMLEGVYAV